MHLFLYAHTETLFYADRNCALISCLKDYAGYSWCGSGLVHFLCLLQVLLCYVWRFLLLTRSCFLWDSSGFRFGSPWVPLAPPLSFTVMRMMCNCMSGTTDASFIRSCLAKIKNWMSSNFLQHKDSKSEGIKMTCSALSYSSCFT